MRIVFFGTSPFAAYVLQHLIDGPDEIVAVITRPDRPRGRNLQISASAVKQYATTHCLNIPLFQPPKASDPEFAQQLQALHADLFVVVAYGEIIKTNLLSMPRLGCVNIHASLLPAWRGAAPMARALMAGDKETGITIIAMTAEMDAGDILAKEAIPISCEMTAGELEEHLRPLAVKLIKTVIEQHRRGNVNRQPQEAARATFALKLTVNDEKINWRHPAEKIHNQIRGLSPAPGAWCELQIGVDRKRLKIKKARIFSLPAPIAAGSFVQFDPKGWIVACGQNALLLQEVQLEGKKVMSALDCLRGLPRDVSLVMEA